MGKRSKAKRRDRKRQRRARKPEPYERGAPPEPLTIKIGEAGPVEEAGWLAVIAIVFGAGGIFLIRLGNTGGHDNGVTFPLLPVGLIMVLAAGFLLFQAGRTLSLGRQAKRQGRSYRSRSINRRRDTRRPLSPTQQRVARFVCAAISFIVGVALLAVGLSNGIGFGVNAQGQHIEGGWFALVGLVMVAVAALCQFGKGQWYHGDSRDRPYPRRRHRDW